MCKARNVLEHFNGIFALQCLKSLQRQFHLNYLSRVGMKKLKQLQMLASSLSS